MTTASAPHSAQVGLEENSTSFRQVISELLLNQRFVDVTLSCEGKLLRCHRLILATSSTYFENLLANFPTPHPVIILHNVKLWQIRAIIAYIYKGEIQVDESKLDELLAVAETLSIRGLCDLKRCKEKQGERAAESQFADVDMGEAEVEATRRESQQETEETQSIVVDVEELPEKVHDVDMGEAEVEAACEESQQEAEETQSIVVDVEELPEKVQLTEVEVKEEMIDAVVWPEPEKFAEILVTDVDMKQENIDAAFEDEVQQPEVTEECPIQREKRAILRLVKEAIVKRKTLAPKICSLDSLCAALVELKSNPDIVCVASKYGVNAQTLRRWQDRFDI